MNNPVLLSLDSIYHIFLHNLIKARFSKRIIEHKMRVFVFSAILFEYLSF